MSENVNTRLTASDLRVELCEEKDAETIAEGLYSAFGDNWWATREPPELRPADYSTRVTRSANRLVASFSNPHMHWLKAVYVPTGEIAGVAGWMEPGNPIHTVWRRSAVEFYNWKEERGWSDADLEEMWTGVDMNAWEKGFEKDDQERREVLGEEPHWYLAPLYTFPAFQGRGVGSMLLKWAFERADATDPVTPLYLEASAMGKPVYLHHGFELVGESNMVRRGPKVVKGEDANKDANKDADAKKSTVEIDIKGVEMSV